MKKLLTLIILIITSCLCIKAQDCNELNIPRENYLQISNCEENANWCVSVFLEDILDYEIYDNGELYAGNYAGCQFDTVIAYSYFTLLGQGSLGPYEVVDWTVNETSFSGYFETMPDLVDSMNTWDPTGNWLLNEGALLIVGGDNNNSYNVLNIEQLQIPGTFAQIGFNNGLTALGTRLDFGVGQHEIVFTEIESNCSDTVQLTVVCVTQSTEEITIYQGLSGNYCFDTAELPGSTFTITQVCDEEETNASYNINTDNLCVNYFGLLEGVASPCFVICDDLGFCDTTHLLINVVAPPVGEVFVATILQGESGTDCLQLDDLLGNPLQASNICEAVDPQVTFQINPSDWCVTYYGDSLGLDTACIVVCDDMGLCDTTLFYINVIAETLPNPIAESDAYVIIPGEGTSITVLENDDIQELTFIDIFELPMYGLVNIEEDNSIFYEPLSGFCGTDSFQYIICNQSSCDTATVSIVVQCPKLEIYTGFSPNGDGVNDTFTIKGANQYASMEIYIYNTWGNLVFFHKGEQTYENTWDGTWDGKNLPDGTYYYLIDLNDSPSTQMTGYLYINR